MLPTDQLCLRMCTLSEVFEIGCEASHLIRHLRFNFSKHFLTFGFIKYLDLHDL